MQQHLPLKNKPKLAQMNKWSISQYPSYYGKIAIITGANCGIGFEAALQLDGKEGLVNGYYCRTLKIITS